MPVDRLKPAYVRVRVRPDPLGVLMKYTAWLLPAKAVSMLAVSARMSGH